MTNTASPDDAAHDSASTVQAGRPPRRWRLAALVVLALASIVLVRALVVQAFVVPSASMEPTLKPGDRLLVWRPSGLLGSVERGDVIVFDGSGLYAPEPAPPRNALAGLGRSIAAALGSPVGRSDYVKRVIGLPGDRVTCCDAQGRLSVNAVPQSEPYLADTSGVSDSGTRASDSAFDIQVPPGRLWVMGDNRGDSADSRAHLGDAAATIPLGRVIGTVRIVWWPVDRTAWVSSGVQRQEAR